MDLTIVYKPLDEVKPYENNPRRNDKAVDTVAESIRTVGFKNPIIVDKDGVIIAGHTRLKAARRLGMETVPVIYASDLTDEQARLLRLADNKTSELADWDDEKLQEEIEHLLQDGIDMTKFGFDVSDMEIDNQEIEEDEAPDLPKEPKTKKGQLWALGDHRLLIGDSTNAEDMKRLMGGELADMIITDPPYNVALGYNMTPEEAKRIKRRTDGKVIKNDSFENDDAYIDFLATAMTNATENTKAGGVFYVWFSSTQSLNVLMAMQKAGLTIREQLIWVKSIFAFGRQDYQWRHEPCLYGWKDGAAHYFINDRTISTVRDDTPDLEKLKKEEAIELLRSIYEQSNILYEKKPSRSEMHPTMKPVTLYGTQIKNSSRKGEKVLDIFAGSGTAAIACEQLGRTAYMMELDPSYADVILQRYEQFTGKKTELLSEATEENNEEKQA